MKKIIRNIFLEVISLWIVDLLFGDIRFYSFGALVKTAVMLAILNSVLKPVLKVLTLPVNFLTFGLFSLVVNGFILSLAMNLVAGAYVGSFIAAIVAAVVLAFVNSIVENILKD